MLLNREIKVRVKNIKLGAYNPTVRIGSLLLLCIIMDTALDKSVLGETMNEIVIVILICIMLCNSRSTFNSILNSQNSSVNLNMERTILPILKRG